MHCNEAQPLLSAFHDGELSPERSRFVEEHIALCQACSQRLDSLRKLSALVDESRSPAAPPSLLAKLQNPPNLDRPEKKLPPRWRSVAVLGGVCATVLVVGLLAWTMVEGPHSHGQMVHDFGEFLNTYERQPNEAANILFAKYKGTPTTEAEATKILKHPTVARPTILHNHQLLQRYLLDMPCCRCVQTVYERDGKVTLILFEHDQEQLNWFGKRSSILASCNGKSCCLIQVGNTIAASWSSGNGYVTAVGIRDTSELDALVNELRRD